MDSMNSIDSMEGMEGAAGPNWLATVRARDNFGIIRSDEL